MNDNRGIYLVQSKDQGKTWSEPIQAFNGAATGFDVVGSPSLLVSENGNLHLMWTKQLLRADDFSQSLALYYARSEDAGAGRHRDLRLGGASAGLRRRLCRRLSRSFCHLSLGDDVSVIVDLYRDLPVGLTGERNPSVLVLPQLFNVRIPQLRQPGVCLPFVLHRAGVGGNGCGADNASGARRDRM